MSKWMYVYQARLALAEWHIKHTESDYLRAMRTADRQIMDALADGTLPSRATEFTLRFDSMKQSRAYSLEPEAMIPTLFWFHWNEAFEEQARRREIIIQSQEQFARSDFQCFEFRQPGLKDDGVLYGRAEGVEVLRDSLPGNMPRPRGNVPGPRVDDSAAIAFAVSRLEAGAPWKETIREAMLKMTYNCTYVSARRRLTNRLKAIGFSEPSSG